MATWHGHDLKAASDLLPCIHARHAKTALSFQISKTLRLAWLRSGAGGARGHRRRVIAWPPRSRGLGGSAGLRQILSRAPWSEGDSSSRSMSADTSTADPRSRWAARSAQVIVAGPMEEQCKRRGAVPLENASRFPLSYSLSGQVLFDHISYGEVIGPPRLRHHLHCTPPPFNPQAKRTKSVPNRAEYTRYTDY